MQLAAANPADLRWLPHAIRIAQEGTSRMRHGAALYRSGRLLRLARNRSRVQDQWLVDRPREECSVHAEAGVLKDLNAAKGATVLVVRVNRAGVLRPSAPCDACWAALDAAGVRKVVHS